MVFSSPNPHPAIHLIPIFLSQSHFDFSSILMPNFSFSFLFFLFSILIAHLHMLSYQNAPCIMLANLPWVTTITVGCENLERSLALTHHTYTYTVLNSIRFHIISLQGFSSFLLCIISITWILLLFFFETHLLPPYSITLRTSPYTKYLYCMWHWRHLMWVFALITRPEAANVCCYDTRNWLAASSVLENVWSVLKDNKHISRRLKR